jgi:type IV pilus assembly protein PilV
MHKQQGYLLLEALISLLLFSFAIIGLAGLEATLLGSSSQSKFRYQAAYLAENIEGLMQGDPSNIGCYALPTPGTCNSSTASGLATTWKNSMPSAVFIAPTVTIDSPSTGLVTVVLQWKRSTETSWNNYTSISSYKIGAGT